MKVWQVLGLEQGGLVFFSDQNRKWIPELSEVLNQHQISIFQARKLSLSHTHTHTHTHTHSTPSIQHTLLELGLGKVPLTNGGFLKFSENFNSLTMETNRLFNNKNGTLKITTGY